MNYTIYIQEKKTESFLKENILEFTKRLGRYCNIRIVWMKKSRDLEKQKIKSGRNLKLTEAEGSISSEQFADAIHDMEIHGISNCNFFICCNPSGLPCEDFSISQFEISPGLLAAILCEQIYRGYRIIHKQPYHK